MHEKKKTKKEKKNVFAVILKGRLEKWKEVEVGRRRMLNSEKFPDIPYSFIYFYIVICIK